MPEDAVIYPPAAAAYFLEEAVRHGAVLLQRQPVVQAGNGAVRLGDGTELHSDAIVLATGVETSLLPWLPIQKRKGHLLLTDRYPGFLSHQLVELGYLKSAHKLAVDSVAFNIQPRRSGQLIIGSSRQYGNEDPAVDEPILQCHAGASLQLYACAEAGSGHSRMDRVPRRHSGQAPAHRAN